MTYIVAIGPIKRGVLCSVFGALFGLLFSWMFHAAVGAPFIALALIADAGFSVIVAMVIGIVAIIGEAKLQTLRRIFVPEGATLYGSAGGIVTGCKATLGWLYITDDGLNFRSAAKKTFGQFITVPADKIESIQKSFLNRLDVFTEKTAYKFLVRDRERWFAELSKIKIPGKH